MPSRLVKVFMDCCADPAIANPQIKERDALHPHRFLLLRDRRVTKHFSADDLGMMSDMAVLVKQEPTTWPTLSKTGFRASNILSELTPGCEAMIWPNRFASLSSGSRCIPGASIANVQNRRRARRSGIGVKGTGCATFRRCSRTGGKTYVAGAQVYLANGSAFGCHDVTRLRRRRKKEIKVSSFHEAPVTICVFSV